MVIVGLIALSASVACGAQAQSHEGQGANLPSKCAFGSLFVKSGANAGPHWCSATDTWSALAGAQGESVPAGSIVLIKTATCPTGYAEDTDLNGRTVIGTLAANGNVGTTGGSDSITSVLNHTHTVNVTDPGHTHTLPVGATDDTAAPFDRADAGSNTGGANATTASGSTATGVTATTANPGGGVASIDNRSAFIRLIACRKT